MVNLQGNESQIAEEVVQGFSEALNKIILISVRKRCTSHTSWFLKQGNY